MADSSFFSHVQSILAGMGLSGAAALSPTPLLVARVADALRAKYPVYGRKKLTSIRQQVASTISRLRSSAGGTDAAGGAAKDEGASMLDDEDSAESDAAAEPKPSAESTPAVSGVSRAAEAPSAAADAARPSASAAASLSTTANAVSGADGTDSATAAASSSARPLLRKRRRVEAGLGSSGASGAGSGAGAGAAGGAGAGGRYDPLASIEMPPAVAPWERLKDVGGVGAASSELLRLLQYPLQHPEVFVHLGVEPPRGVLLHGPPGAGKTLLARALGGEIGCYFRQVDGTDVIAGISGESEARLRALFEDAAAHAPAILFIDELDSLAPRREGGAPGRGMDRRVLATLATCMDALPSVRAGRQPVIVLAATDKPESVDASLRRAGRFDREIAVPVPDEAGRAEILRLVTAGMRIAVEPPAGSDAPPALASSDAGAAAAREQCLQDLARATPGFVGADLVAVAKEAAVAAINRFVVGLEASGRGAGLSSAAVKGLPTATSAAASTLRMDGDDEDDVAAAAAAAAEQARQGLAGLGLDASGAGAASASAATSAGAHGVADAASNDGKLARPDAKEKEKEKEKVEPFPLDLLESTCFVTRADLFAALKRVQPAALREGFATIPNVTWGDVGALQAVRAELDMAILQPLRYPGLFTRMGLRAPAGLLLYGPPGCGKTLLAKAVANETHANFISVKGPELLDKYVGESERAVRQLFTRARASAPCIIFFDELDALAPRRGGSSEGSGVSERVVNQLLTELDGLDVRRDVFVLAATNRPDIIDPAMLRPGRLEKLLYVPLPREGDRADILRTHARSTPVDASVDLEALARDSRCRGFSGADLASLVREAATAALKQFLATLPPPAEGATAVSAAAGGAGGAGAGAAAAGASLPVPAVTLAHFEEAFTKVHPSVSATDERTYASLQTTLRKTRGHIGSGGAAGSSGAGAGAERHSSHGHGHHEHHHDAGSTTGAGALEASNGTSGAPDAAGIEKDA